jgi:hypothetical protein
MGQGTGIAQRLEARMESNSPPKIKAALVYLLKISALAVIIHLA